MNIISASLRGVGNIVTGDDLQTQVRLFWQKIYSPDN